MAAPALASRPLEVSERSEQRTLGRVFGIEFDIDLPIWPVNAGRGEDGCRPTVVEGTTLEALRAVWRPAEPERVLERLFPNGQASLEVDFDPRLGYHVWARRMGRHLISPDGSHVSSVPSRLPAWVWQRLLFGQVLPLVATLRGRELLHASAVVLGQKTLAFSAASGTGKTSVAAHLVASGATLLTDDVLAVEVVEGRRLLAHPGGPIVAVAPAELQQMQPEDVTRLGVPGGRHDKVMFKAKLASEPSCLDAIYFLERSDSPGDLVIDDLQHDPLRPLGQSFNGYICSRERVSNQLAVALALVETVQMFSVVVPPSCPAPRVADAVRRHAAEAV